jgi:hypothetical protein
VPHASFTSFDGIPFNIRSRAADQLLEFGFPISEKINKQQSRVRMWGSGKNKSINEMC